MNKLLMIALLVLLAVSGCSSPQGRPPADIRATGTARVEPTATELAPGMPKGPDALWHVVIIGDSSTWKLGEAMARRIEQDVGVKAMAENYSIPNLSAGDVLDQLLRGSSKEWGLRDLPQALPDADYVVMWVNPDDSVDPVEPLNFDGCFYGFAPKSCKPAAYQRYTADLKAIWAEIFRMRAGQPTILRAADFYNPNLRWWKQTAVFEACNECWGNLSDAVRNAADAYRIPVLERYKAFNGPNGDEDPMAKGFISEDLEHPTELAAEYEAELLSEMGYAPVTPP